MVSKVKVVCALEACGLLSEPSKRQFWVHPFSRSEGDADERFNTFYQDIRQHDVKFFEYYRMSVKSFDELLRILRPRLTKKNTNFRKAITAEERLTITLRYLSTGMTFSSMHYEFHRGKSTIAILVRETCREIFIHLKNEEMPEPTTEMWRRNADDFYDKTNYPNCIGAVGGKHLRCVSTVRGETGSFKSKYFSIVVIALVDANLRFVTIDIGAFHRDWDATVFKDSELGKKLYSGTLKLPPPAPLPNTDGNPQPFVVVGDEAFKLSTNLMSPFPSRGLTARSRVYNYRHRRCRRTVECAFGVLANKWRVFHTQILIDPEYVDDIVKSCCVLHNFIAKRDGINFEDTETHPFQNVKTMGRGPRGKGKHVRETFTDYFMGEGAVSFQKTICFD